MTRIAGYRLGAAPCCGAHYRRPVYASRNFSASEYWTDGYREGSLMPNDHGLRACRCGQFFVLDELQDLGLTDQREVPLTARVAALDLRRAIAQAPSLQVMRAARLDHWLEHNHPYRVRYRAHRKAEIQTQAPHPQPQPLMRPSATAPQTVRPAPTVRPRLEVVSPPPHAAPIAAALPPTFSCPAYLPSQTQQDNLRALLSLDTEHGQVLHPLQKAELLRELGAFEPAAQALQQIPTEVRHGLWQVLTALVQLRQNAPMRYYL